MGQPEIRAATPAQAAELTALMHASSAYQGDYASILEGYEVTPGYIESNPTFTAMTEGEVIGFYALREDPPELDIMFVADKAQGLGLGARLIKHMVKEASIRGMRSIRVVSHPPALQFYIRMGANQTGTIPPTPPKIRWERPELHFDVPS
ncbi:N-acetyltransferase [Amycolatopsis sp. NBRC 101858]|uniref:GNAT family N-acetyltransferase n=1 Tax=Amycolatopsis sp. NBRC 101858 TaxID=3032200 RepID=UPI0024A0156C|nr:GNAT family N-acetyltransferase [Amycolatopsis sp. NBRC 101858]GLY34005.1 N-acetyltransferase [Amycolatopsis sp. NBRC 101858]